MSTFETGFDNDNWRMLLFAGNGTELLVLKRPLGLCLPTLRIPQHERIAASLNAEAERSWKIETVCIAPFRISHPDENVGEARYHVMEVPNSEELSRIAPNAMDVASLPADAFSDVRDYLAIRRAMQLDGSSLGCHGPFSTFGSFAKLSGWVEEQLQLLGRKRNGSYRQYHATECFALIRFETADGAVWFKATGEPNQKELAITQRLAALFPEWLPEILSAHSNWNAWLTDDVPGVNLESTGDLSAWCCAAESLAQLQVASIPHASTVLDCGAHDASVRTLLTRITPFFEAVEILMDEQTKATPPPLRSSDVRELRLRVTEALQQLESIAIPDTLNHFDLNPANGIVSPRGCKFLDWAEAAVGNPFFSFEYLRQHVRRAFNGEPQAETKLREAYLNVWRRTLPIPAIDRVVALMPLVAPFAYAATSLDWNSSRGNANREAAGFLRSLARRMHREAGQLLCAAWH